MENCWQYFDVLFLLVSASSPQSYSIPIRCSGAAFSCSSSPFPRQRSFFISHVPSIQLTAVPAALRGIRGTVQSSWIWNICQEYSSGAVVHILTNQHWINSMYLHSKQLIQKKYSLHKLLQVHLSIVPVLINCSCLSILDCTVLVLILSSPFPLKIRALCTVFFCMPAVSFGPGLCGWQMPALRWAVWPHWTEDTIIFQLKQENFQ